MNDKVSKTHYNTILNRQGEVMSQVILLLLFPIGFYFYFFKERPARPAYAKVFTDFEADIQDDDTLSQGNKIEHFKEMLLKNDYKIIKTTTTVVMAEKKIFSMSLFTISVGLFYVGAVAYLVYFYYFQKPHRIVFRLAKIQ